MSDQEKKLERATKKAQKARQREENYKKRREEKIAKREAKLATATATAEEKKAAAREAHRERVKAAQIKDMPHVNRIPPVPKGQVQLTFQEIVPALAAVRVLHDTEKERHVYEVIEPHLRPAEKEVLDFLRDTLVRTLDGRHPRDEERWRDALIDAALDAIVDHDVMVGPRSEQRILYHLLAEFLGYGPVEAIMRDPMIEDISCDGPGIPLYVFHRDYESIRTNVVFEDDLDLDSFVIRLAQRSGKHISVANPLLDATLPDGSRLQATLSREVTTRGSSFTIRKFREVPLTPIDLVGFNTISPHMAAYLWIAIEMGQSLMLAGGTASGKTTSLNAILQFVPPEKKVVSIEDTREINLIHENWIAGLTRGGFGASGQGAVDMYKLLEAALRQRPEYLVVGEVRGKEAQTLFQAMATGHAAYGTMHADSVASAVHRLEHQPINVPRIMLPILNILCIQAQARTDDGTLVRRMKAITELIDMDPESNEILTNEAYQWNSATDEHEYTGASVVLDRYRLLNKMSEEDLDKEIQCRVDVIEWLRETGKHRLQDIHPVILAYYRDKKALLERVRGS